MTTAVTATTTTTTMIMMTAVVMSNVPSAAVGVIRAAANISRTYSRALSIASSKTRAGLLVTRPPVLLPKLEPFATEYYKYAHANAHAQTQIPFNSAFYFKQGTDAELQWAAAQKAAGATSTSRPVMTRRHDREIEGVVNELLKKSGSGATEDSNNEDKIASQTKTHTEREDSLDRRMHEALFLVVGVKNNDSNNIEWQLPEGNIEKDELLHEVGT